MVFNYFDFWLCLDFWFVLCKYFLISPNLSHQMLRFDEVWRIEIGLGGGVFFERIPRIIDWR